METYYVITPQPRPDASSAHTLEHVAKFGGALNLEARDVSKCY